MSQALLEAIESYTDRYESNDERFQQRAPQPTRGHRGWSGKRKRTAGLGIRGRNRSRSVKS